MWVPIGVGACKHEWAQGDRKAAFDSKSVVVMLSDFGTYTAFVDSLSYTSTHLTW